MLPDEAFVVRQRKSEDSGHHGEQDRVQSDSEKPAPADPGRECSKPGRQSGEENQRGDQQAQGGAGCP